MFFIHDCRGTNFNTNIFGSHDIALRMAWNAVFGDMNNLNVQEHHGNIWNGNPYPVAGATHETDMPITLDYSNFVIHDENSSYWPDPILLPNMNCNLPTDCDWFVEDPSGTPLACNATVDCPERHRNVKWRKQYP